jgi:hypothetical protein
VAEIGMPPLRLALILLAVGVATGALLLWHFPELRRHEEVRMEHLNQSWPLPGIPTRHPEPLLVADGGAK